MLARAWTFLVLAAFLARAAVPQGFMAEIDAGSGLLTVSMCTADGSHKAVPVNIPVDKPAKKQDGEGCPDALAKFADLPPHDPVVVAAEAYVFAVALIETAPWPVEETWPAHAPPTGPPQLS
jgi:hypothetical protein